MSGIYIPGMEMPTSCFDCPVAHPALGNLVAAILGCPLIGKTLSAPFCEEKRMEDCPLIPVPDHGRLIDKDVMCNECRRVAEEYDGIYLDCTYCPANLAPTIIPAEEGQ